MPPRRKAHSGRLRAIWIQRSELAGRWCSIPASLGATPAYSEAGLAIQADGKIIAAGDAKFSGGPSGLATVARCCDPATNQWTFQTCSFSEYLLGTTASDLIPGGGSPSVDCVAELAVDNPLNAPAVDRAQLPSSQQTCRDGEPTCDKDGAADGKCEFDVSVCVNLNDGRRLDDAGAPACQPTSVAAFTVQKPRPDSAGAVDAGNGQALRDAVQALDPSSLVGGDHLETVSFGTPLTDVDRCSAPARVIVPLRGAQLDKQGKATIKLRTVTAPAPGRKDSDKLKLVCLPPS